MDFISQEKNLTIYNLINKKPCAVLATRSGDREVNLAHVFVCVDEQFRLFFISRPENRKADNILTDGQVSLFFSDQDTVEQVEYIGEAEQVTDANVMIDNLSKLQGIIMDHKVDYWVPPVSQLEGQGYLMFCVMPKNVTYRKYESSANENKLEEIIADLSI